MAGGDTLDLIQDCIHRRESFIVEAGAGAGKTSALVATLNRILANESAELARKNRRIACITYTNVAKSEIAERLGGDPLASVLTIHEFLWGVIKNFQAELRAEVIDINRNAKRPKAIESLDGVPVSYTTGIRNFERGRVSHDDVIDLAHRLFTKYPKISRIVANRYPYIFVDEYQDTHPKTVSALVDHLLLEDNTGAVVGFFGDSMQKIYNTGVGRVERPHLTRITIKENYRCSRAVIDVLNRMRPELLQTAAGDNAEGSVTFRYSGDGPGADPINNFLIDIGWNLDTTKVLMLTHRGLADRLSYPNLLNAYDTRSSFGIEDFTTRTDEYGELFAHLESLVSDYNAGRFGNVISTLMRHSPTHQVVRTHDDKVRLARVMTELERLRLNCSVGDVLTYVFQNSLLCKPRRVVELEALLETDDLTDRQTRKRDFYLELQNVPYREVAQFQAFLDRQTPFSTKHGVKGAEFDDVLVVIDDRLWNMYNFECVFANDQTKSQYERTRNLLYVSCSRARTRLAILCVSHLGPEARNGARRMFGEG